MVVERALQKYYANGVGRAWSTSQPENLWTYVKYDFRPGFVVGMGQVNVDKWVQDIRLKELPPFYKNLKDGSVTLAEPENYVTIVLDF